MNRKFLKKAFSQAELLVTIGVLGCIIALGVIMFNASRVNNNVELTKQARLESTLRTATMSILSKENKVSVNQVCDANNLRALLKARIAGAQEDTIKVNGHNDVLALRVKNLGTIAIQTGNNCSTAFAIGTITDASATSANPSVALYTTPDENITELTIPVTSVPTTSGTDSSVGDSSQNSNTTYSSEFVAYSISSTGIEETASSAASVLAAATPPTVGTATKTAADSDKKFLNHDESFCRNGVYDGTTICPNITVQFYQMWEAGNCNATPTYCEGNGQLEDGSLILTGKVNYRCSQGDGNFGQCACPSGQTYWIPGKYYTLQGKDGSKIIGLCVGKCSDFDEHMIGDDITKICECDTDKGYNWDATLKKCVKPGECSEAYLVWDETKGACVCNETYVRERLAEDEVYTGIVANQCKKKCDTANYWFPNEDKTECERRLPECECLKELNFSDYECYCKKAEDLNNAALVQCSVQNNQYYTGIGACVADCTDNYNSYKVRDTQNITSCICQATKPSGMTLGNYEVYDPSSTITCRKCNPNYPNREYETDIGPGSCECKDINDPTLIMGNRQYYDPTAANCVGTCPEGEVPNPSRTGCQPNCGCLEKLVNNVCVCNTDLTAAEIKACADFKGDIFDPMKTTCQDNCNGTSHADTTLRECICDGCAEKYTGTTCVCDEAVSTANKCVKSDEKYDPESLICKSCKSINREYNAQGECVCKQVSEIIFSDVNMVYDITQPNCEAPCDGILIRNRNNPQECVCPSAKPTTFKVSAGYHYDNTAKATGCVSPCPIGDYCPGSNPNDPSTPAIDPQDPNPTIDTTYTEGDVYKCPCGTYGNTTGLKTATCSNLCPAGSKCSVPGTITPVPCSGSELCLQGQINQCNPSTCTDPFVPSADHTTCVCASSKPATYSLPAGYKYDSTQATCIRPCPAGDYCPGSKEGYPDQPNMPAIGTDPLDPNPIMEDDNDKFVYKCPCGRYSTGSINSTTSACMGECYKGYYCTKGSTTPTQHECTPSQKCPTGLNTCAPESCTLPFVPNTDQIACVCAVSKPDTYSLPAGYKYDSTQATCIKPCPAGDYCPGSKEGYPDQPNMPAIGTDPLDPNPTMEDDNDKFVYKCPCGKYSSGSIDSKTSSCLGDCSLGYYCTKGSTTPTQNKCTSQQKCPTGLNTCMPEECTSPYIPNEEQTACICGLSSTPPAGKYFRAETCEYIDCPVGHYCPGPNPGPYPDPEPDPYYPPNVIYCPCGMYQDVPGSSTCKSDCALGYYCPKGSTSNKGLVGDTEHKCKSSQRCPVGTCQPQECTDPFVPTADQTACECAQTRPKGYPIEAGYKYSANHPENGCMVKCPAGDYCPGSDPTNPDKPKVDPNDPDPTIDDDDPFTLKCPCGTYSTGSEESKTAACMGKCTKGYYCKKGSTTPTQNKCTSQQKCPTGLNTCSPEECELPFIPNTDQTACVCSGDKPIGYKIPAGYTYNNQEPSTCLSICPKGDYCPGSNPSNPEIPIIDPDDPKPIIDGDDPFKLKCPCGNYGSITGLSKAACSGKCKAGYNCPAGSTSATQNKCTGQQLCKEGVCKIEECTLPMIPNEEHTACVCSLIGAPVPAGKYFDLAQCAHIDCPKGHYCPGSNPDPNPSPQPDPDYPSGVIFCPCGTYGETKGLSVYTCSGQCPIGYYCPQGSENPTEHQCQAGQSCHIGTCEPDTCAFPTTSIAPYETCNECMSEADIKKIQADYFKQNEIWVNDVSIACKKCKSNMVPVEAGGCDCPDDEPYWYNDKCNMCQDWGKLYFARNFTETAKSCKLEKFLKGDVSCFDGSDGRVVPQDMKDMANKLSNDDKNRTFDKVFAYVIAEKSDNAQVIGVFTISSWYAAFPSDYDSDYNTATQEKNRIKGTCSQMCANINSSLNSLCVSTCEQFTGNTNSMFDHCAYAVNNKKNPQFIGQSYGTRSDELCTGGEIKLKNNCFYDLGNVLRRRYSPLVLDLKGNGFAYTSVEDGVIFDLNKDGVAERTAWTDAQTEFDNAFLILDKNKNGQVDNGGELFGDQNGEENGFKELAKYDSNGDKVINKKDPIYTELRLWVDMNKNAKIDYNTDGTSKELKTLEEAGVTEISVDFQKLLDKKGNVLEDMYGNLVGIMGKFKMMVKNAAGKLVETVRKMMDVFFVTQ